MAQDTRDRPLAAIAFIIVAITVMSGQDVILKLMSDRYPVWQFAVIRSVVAVALLVLALVFTGHLGLLRPRLPGLLVLRGLLTFVASTAYYLAIAAVPLADAVAMFFCAPLVVTALSVPLLGEPVGPRRWTAVILGFVGVLVIVRPGFATMQGALLIAALTPVAYGLSIIITRRIGYAVAGSTLALYNMVVFGLASAAGSLLLHFLPLGTADHPSLAFLIRDWSMPSPLHLALMSATGLITAVGHYFTARAYRDAAPSLVAPFEYTYFLLAIAFGFLFWRDVPDPPTFIGVGIIFASGIYIAHREATLARARSRAALAAGADTGPPARG